MYLLDTNVVSALAPARRLVTPSLAAWLERRTDRLYLSAMTVAEITEGVAKTRRQGSRRKANELDAWLESLLAVYGNRVLSIDVGTARLIGLLSDLARSKGKPPGLADIIIAATARRHTLTLLTRNIRHFVPLEVPALDPFEALPP